LAKPPLELEDWSDDKTLEQAIPDLHPCMQGFPSQNFLNFEYQMEKLSESEYQFMLACEENQEKQFRLSAIFNNCELDLNGVRSLFERQLIILSS